MRVFFALGLWFSVFACNIKSENQESDIELEASDLSGEQLARWHCGSCHLFPEPSLLPKNIWTGSVLPKMAFRLGLGDFFTELINMTDEESRLMLENEIYSSEPKMHTDDWQKIIDYYSTNSKEIEDLKFREKKILLKDFEVEQLNFKGNEIVMTKYDKESNSIFVSEAVSSNLLKFQNKKFEEIQLKNKNPIVDFAKHIKYGKVWLEIGNMNPNDRTEGVLRADNKILIQKLRRPVDLQVFDFNEDGFDDFLISNFGNNVGDLSWYDGKNLKQNILSNQPGSRNSFIVDFDQDGRKDIVSLFTQGKESIVFFRNLGKGKFEPQTLLEFVPVYGSSYFELIDFNGDGNLDIVYSNGDNADYSIVPKPYHGIRVFVNEGKNQFLERYFFPQNGASKVIARDFDNDGDIDLASISYFPLKGQNEGFVFLQNQGDLNFKSYYIPQISSHRFLTIDSHDIDGDGDQDLVLGRFDRGPESQYKKSENVFLLINNLKP